MQSYYGNQSAIVANAKYASYGLVHEVSNGRVVAVGYENQAGMDMTCIWKDPKENPSGCGTELGN